MVWPTLGLRAAEEQSKTVTKLERTSLCSATYVADNVALPAFAAARPPCCQAAAGERRAAIDRYLLLAVPTAGNQQQRSAAGEWDRRQTDTVPLHRPCSAYYAGGALQWASRLCGEERKWI